MTLRSGAARRRVQSPDFVTAARAALASGDVSALSWQELQEVLTAATKVYAAKAESEGIGLPALDPASVTATEVVVTVSEMMRAASLNPFDLAMWFRRSPLDRAKD